MSDEAIMTGKHFMNGDEACAEGALAAGCRFFAGYPITPQSEIAERMSKRMPEVGGRFIQMEDELSSIAAVLGGSWGGSRAMTATSGPGFSLMMENIGLGMMTETPCVIANIQRGSPSTGLPTAVGQGDMMQAQWGSHGDYGVIAYAPTSPQEMFDFTVKAFNKAEQYMMPVFVMADEKIGHMRERVEIDESKVEIYPRRKPEVDPDEFKPYEPDDDLVPRMASAGEGYRVHVTGLTHNQQGYPQLDVETQQEKVGRLVDKVDKNKDDIVELDTIGIEDAEVLIVSYGMAFRTAMGAYKQAREKGIKAGIVRLVTVWPFPEDEIKEFSKQVKGIVVPEINLGQMVREVERASAGNTEVKLVPHPGGGLHEPEQILESLEALL
ncbi:MAG: 2-oxoacid:acceptor oxidoreductase subunit alpha [Candidatus Bipolaricaulota bacterium]|nr:2-oxoacid:acceptor oxidoreductase subunit alpha [Candidatus Bipolaricaulota bacterium]MBS3792236.1 2-oxoacid:acceptor oxidoreductase subunit alpha [Candidatus Bipolaricaulota bacterium]